MNHLIAPSSSGIEAARPQSTIVRERGRALIIDACRSRRDTPSVGSERRRSPERAAKGETRRKQPFVIHPTRLYDHFICWCPTARQRSRSGTIASRTTDYRSSAARKCLLGQRTAAISYRTKPRNQDRPRPLREPKKNQIFVTKNKQVIAQLLAFES